MFDLSVRSGQRYDSPARGIVKLPKEKRDRWLSDFRTLPLVFRFELIPTELLLCSECQHHVRFENKAGWPDRMPISAAPHSTEMRPM